MTPVLTYTVPQSMHAFDKSTAFKVPAQVDCYKKSTLLINVQVFMAKMDLTVLHDL